MPDKRFADWLQEIKDNTDLAENTVLGASNGINTGAAFEALALFNIIRNHTEDVAASDRQIDGADTNKVLKMGSTDPQTITLTVNNVYKAGQFFYAFQQLEGQLSINLVDDETYSVSIRPVDVFELPIERYELLKFICVSASATAPGNSTWFVERVLNPALTQYLYRMPRSEPTAGEVVLQAGDEITGVYLAGSLTQTVIVPADNVVDFKDGSLIWLYNLHQGEEDIEVTIANMSPVALTDFVIPFGKAACLQKTGDNAWISVNPWLGNIVGVCRNESASYQDLAGDFIVAVDASGGARTVTLASSSVLSNGQMKLVYDVNGNAATNNITIDGNAANINGASTLVLNTNYAMALLAWNGTKWNAMTFATQTESASITFALGNSTNRSCTAYFACDNNRVLIMLAPLSTALNTSSAAGVITAQSAVPARYRPNAKTRGFAFIWSTNDATSVRVIFEIGSDGIIYLIGEPLTSGAGTNFPTSVSINWTNIPLSYIKTN